MEDLCLGARQREDKDKALLICDSAAAMWRGRVIDNGKLFALLIQSKVFEQPVTRHSEHGAPARPRLVMTAASTDGWADADAHDTSESVPESTRPTDWSKITAGSLVLVEEARMEGWFEAIVLEA